MLHWLTAGESHGRALVAICEGMPAGVQISTADIAAALARRRAGYGRGVRMKFEQDEAEITGGVRHGVTLGGPVAIRVANTEWPKWETVMSADPVPAAELADQARNAPLTRPRPGHADLAGMQKYGHQDARPVLERASARETAARVALGEVARQYLRQAFGIEIVSHVVSIGSVCAPEGGVPRPEDAVRVDEDPVRCLDPAASAAMASATTPAAGTAVTSLRWLIALAGSPERTSTVSRALGTVEIGFIAARTRITSPVLMPPSIPPARLVRLLMPLFAASISSCAAEPRRRAVAKPSPISTPLMA